MFHHHSRTILKSCFILLISGSWGVAADPVQWRTDYSTARREAEEKNLPMLVVVGTDECIYCRKQEATTFADEDVLALLIGKVVFLKVDAEKDAEFARAMRVTIYPTTIIAGVDGKVFAYLAGYVPPDQFRDHATKTFGLIAKATEKNSPKLSNDAVLTARVQPERSTVPAVSAAVGIDEMRAAVKAERFADALERAEAVAGAYPNTPAGEEAVGVLSLIRSDTEKLALAAEQMDAKLAAGYFAIAEGYQLKGMTKEAASYFEKVVLAAPESTHAERARVRIATISRTK